MVKDGDVRRAIVNQRDLPLIFPTHRHAAQFWEALGRAIATFGFLEETLGKPIFVFTATRTYSEREFEEAYKSWLPQLEKGANGSIVEPR